MVIEPLIQIPSTADVRQQLDPEADLRDRDHADVQKVERLRGDKLHHVAIRLRTPKLRQDVGVEQPASHSSTSRTGLRALARSIVTSASGESWSSFTRASPVGSPLTRRYSSTETTTTSSRPSTVMRCGPS